MSSSDAIYVYKETNLKLYAVKWICRDIRGDYTKYECNQIFRDSEMFRSIDDAVLYGKKLCEGMYNEDGFLVTNGVILLENFRDD